MAEGAPDRARFLSTAGKPLLEVRRLSRTTYSEAHALQEALVAQRVAGSVSDQLLFTEHEPVITIGRGGDVMPDDVRGVPVVAVERGGEATYHGPGQLVAYPIVLLEDERRDLHRYLRDLEEVVIRVLADVGVVGSRKPGLTGVWVEEKKICSLGVAVRRWVAWHGFALNLRTDLAVFRSFRPCGLDPDVMTRLADHARIPDGTAFFEDSCVEHFCAVFGHELVPRR
ncbi:MAG TPA: lipoyl(octanoyl) transferase LipB [Planctomycetota bacterium]|nr:lipoyl(octanoyl) transferase LipB [Planctomycetota bacterium]